MAEDREEPANEGTASAGIANEGIANEGTGGVGQATDLRRVEATIDAWFTPQPAAGDIASSDATPSPSAPGNPTLAPAQGTSSLIENVRADANGADFTRQLLESLVQSPDPFTAALRFRDASKRVPASMPAGDRFAIRAGSVASLGLPWAVLPLARRRLRDRVSELILTARLPHETVNERHLQPLRASLSARRQAGYDVVVRSVGEEVLGPEGVQNELQRLMGLAAEPLVTHIVVDPARIAPGSDWSIDADATRAAEHLDPLCAAAAAHDVTLVFTPSTYRSARMTPAMLEHSSLAHAYRDVAVAVTLPADVPESTDMLTRLTQWAGARESTREHTFELVVGFGRFAGEETATALHTGLPTPVLPDAAARQAQWMRLVNAALQASHDTPLTLTLASEDPLLIAAAMNMAVDQHLPAPTVQLRAATAEALAHALSRSGVSVRIETPVVSPAHDDLIAPFVLALIAEAAEASSGLTRARSTDVFLKAVEALSTPAQNSHRVQTRRREWEPSERDSALFYRPPNDDDRHETGGLTAAVLGLKRGEQGELLVAPQGDALRIPHVSESGFANEPATDPVVHDNREWMRELMARAAQVRRSRSEHDLLDADADADAAEGAGTVKTTEVDELLTRLLEVAAPWRIQPPRDRATRLRRLALGVAAARDHLLTELTAETGAPVTVLDAEVNGVIDAARYLGERADGLGAVHGAQFRPDPLTLIVFEAGVPFAERAEALLAALAAGSAVVCAAHESVEHSTRALIEEWQAAGLPEGVIVLRRDTDDFAAACAADERVDRAIVLGSRSAARALIRRRPHLRVDGRFRERGTVLVAPSADQAAAARGIVASAFGGGVASARSARVVILVGSAFRSPKLTGFLADAVRSLRVGDTATDTAANGAATDTAAPRSGDVLTYEWGPLADLPSEAGLRALTELEPGEAWLVQPERLDEAGLVWRPGIRVGLRPDAPFWRDAVGMPVIGLIGARSFDEAVRLQTLLGGGGVAALYSNEADELVPWLERTSAASLTVNRPTEPARIERLPGGGWGAAGMGVETLAGGPNRLVTLGSWKLRVGSQSSTLHLRGLDPEIQVLIDAARSVLDYELFDRVRRAALSDALSWRTTLGRVHDEIGLGVECNVLRRWPVATQIRLAESGPLAGLVRVLAAALLVRAPVTVSTGVVLPKSLTDYLALQGVVVWLERDEDWLERIAIEASAENSQSAGASGSFAATGEPMARVRLIGGDPVRTAEWLGGQERVSVWADPVTMAGPVELLAFLREQSISISTQVRGFAQTPEGLTEWIEELDSRSSHTI